jgi:DNA polymerase-1
MDKTLYLIDGYGFLFRAFHSLPPLTSLDGTPIGAIYGFVNMLYKFISKHEADMIAVVLDSGQKNFRHEIYTEYKANRPSPPEELIVQFPIVREAIDAFNIISIEKSGYEADDLIAAYAKEAEKQGYKVKIISSDKDLMQLVSENISMYDAMRDKVIDAQAVVDKFGVGPELVLDILSILGDSSDNVPGIKGVGQKTAEELLKSFGTLDGIYNNLEQIKQERRKQLLIDGKANAYLSKKLINLDVEAPREFSFTDLAVKPVCKDKLLKFCQHHAFKNLIAKLSTELQVNELESNKAQEFQKIEIFTCKKYVDKFIKNGVFAFYFNENEFFITSNQLNLKISINNSTKQVDLFSNSEESVISSILLDLKSVFEEPSIKKIAADVKQLLKLLDKLEIKLNNYDDVALMAYSVSTGKHGYQLKNIILEHLGHEEIDSNSVYKVYLTLQQKLYQDKQFNLYYNIEKPLIGLLDKIEGKGVKIDAKFLSELTAEFNKHLEVLAKEIYAIAGKTFNIGSPKQLGEILFDDLKLDSQKKSKSGAYSTSYDILESLAAQGHIIAAYVIKWRQFSKLISTYTEALPKYINQNTGRVHTTFIMTGTSTGRLSSTDPNLQNIPIRTDEGSQIRKAFIAEVGKTIISADYSQIELRLLAQYADIKPLKDAFINGLDIHAVTASEMFGMPVEQVDANYRRKAKTINFGIIYGISAFGLAQRLEIPRKAAQEYIDKYFAKYPGIKEYMVRTVDFAKKHGYVNTLFGRKCYINGLTDQNFAVRGFAERAAINAPLQGTAADIIKKAMVMMPSNIADCMVLQIHDELLFEVLDAEVDKFSKAIKQVMENVLKLDIPLTVDVSHGKNWLEAH